MRLRSTSRSMSSSQKTPMNKLVLTKEIDSFGQIRSFEILTDSHVKEPNQNGNCSALPIFV